MNSQPWWSSAVVYQLYVRSFADSNGDGKGDLAGIRSRLPYLQTLGVDALWLNPCYPSPQHDHGYDVSNYFEIEPDYGTLAEFDDMVADATDHGIKILMDVVPNHCSWDHPWFRAALAAAPGSPERDRFWFRDGRGPNGDEPPNNWQSIFGGSTWTRITEPDGSPGQWYLHIFANEQPDFNLHNEDVAQHFDDMLRFWFDRGVAGFRADAVAVAGKAPGLPDDESEGEQEIGYASPFFNHRPEGHLTWQRWRRVVDQYNADHPGRDVFVVCESYTPDETTLRSYVNDDEFHQCFAFDLMLAPWRAEPIRQAIETTIGTLHPHGLHAAWTLNNHDAQRAVTRRGRHDAHISTHNNLWNSDAPVDELLGLRRANALALLQFALPGSIYLYCGEELGLPEVLDIPAAARQDPVFKRTQGRQPGRDGCRVPLPWTSDEHSSFGFSANKSESPWMPQPTGWGEYAASLQVGRDGSTFELYRAAIALRRLHGHFESVGFEWIDAGNEVVAFKRGEILVALNVSGQPATLPSAWGHGEILLSSDHSHSDGTQVPADTAVWLHV